MSDDVQRPPEVRASDADREAIVTRLQAAVGEGRIDLHLSTVFGDIDVIVAEGVDAELHGRTVFGDRKVQLAPVERVAGTPLVVVHAKAVFGDLKLRSLPPGDSPTRWGALMERLAQRRQIPPP